MTYKRQHFWYSLFVQTTIIYHTIPFSQIASWRTKTQNNTTQHYVILEGYLFVLQSSQLYISVFSYLIYSTINMFTLNCNQVKIYRVSAYT